MTKIKPRTPKAEEYYQKEFLPKIEKIKAEIDDTPFSVFLCGPSKSTHCELYEKRVETTNALRKKSLNAFLGEEIVRKLESQDVKAGLPKQSPDIYEHRAVLVSDLIIIFHEGPGAIAEAQIFLNDKHIAGKTIVFLDKKHRGFVTETLESLKQRGIQIKRYKSPEDIEQCHLKSNVIAIVDYYRQVKWHQEKNK